MKLVIGLGNPGKKYENTRHNMGFNTLDVLASKNNISLDKEVFDGVLGRGIISNQDTLLFKPYTYMNLSGTAVQQVVHFYKIDINDIYVICDDLALKPGDIRLRKKGSSGGQKGLQNIIDCLNTEEFKRIRIGIGEPTFDVVDYVLGKPLKEEQPLIEEAINKASLAIEEALKSDFDRAMSKYN